ncbi:hypothetical protein MTR67_025889 [Solanum verrucosum]|uniref:Uncharacterized protein n=1 Tax=Solanum verrucosum TaxID=315347 RepID=A0AAF0QXY3_SOLVR|nr:hypothetical protein MTR67_025889 [Solanum verrucosum]
MRVRLGTINGSLLPAMSRV